MRVTPLAAAGTKAARTAIARPAQAQLHTIRRLFHHPAVARAEPMPPEVCRTGGGAEHERELPRLAAQREAHRRSDTESSYVAPGSRRHRPVRAARDAASAAHARWCRDARAGAFASWSGEAERAGALERSPEGSGPPLGRFS